MKAIINRKVYDTDTAETIVQWTNGAYRSDFHWRRETLYRTKKGNWFIMGEGGPNSPYAEYREGGRSCTWGERIVPLTDQEAYAWLEERGFAQAISKWFGSQIQEA